jgi:hypothetical protein
MTRGLFRFVTPLALLEAGKAIWRSKSTVQN